MKTNYATITSDRSRKKAILLLLLGCVGLHYFYVGRILKGLCRFVFGALVWLFVLSSDLSGDPSVSLITAILFFIMLVINFIDLVKLFLGTFKDNVGNYLRA